MAPLRITIMVFVLGLVLSACDSSSQPDAAAIAAASGDWKTCAGCHGAQAEGNATLQAPALVNLDAWYLKRQLQNFRSGVRGSHPADTFGAQMAASSALLADDAAIDAVIGQISGFSKVQPAATLSGDASIGKDFYSMTCGACHGPEAVGNLALNAPALRGIDDWYLQRQYENFRDGIRGSHDDDVYGRQMQRMGQVLKSEDDIRNVTAYLQSLGIKD
jgi:cytochrome c553